MPAVSAAWAFLDPRVQVGLAFLLGAVVGSFLNVVIHRLPRRQSLLWPGSYCPACRAALRPWDLVPVLSYLALRGRCRYCGSPVGWRYPAVEVLTGLAYALVYQRLGWGWELPGAFVLVGVVTAAAFIDLEHGIIPNRLVLAGAGAGVLLFWWPTPLRLADGLLGAATTGGLFLAVALAYPGGMGGGDVKLAALVGFYLGWRLGLLAMVLAVVLGGAVGLALVAWRVKGRKDPIPFGPFLAAGAVLALAWGPDLIRWLWGVG